MPEAPSPYAPPASDLRPPPGGPGGTPSPAGEPLPQAYTLLAVLLSLLIPGLGHVYARRGRRGAAWLAAVYLLSVIEVLAVRAGPRGFLVILGVVAFNSLGLRLGATIDAALLVHRHPGPRARVVTTLGFAVLIVVALIGNPLVVRRFAVEAFKIPSGSMIPTLLIGEHIFVDKQRTAERGDVIVFPFPEHPEQDFVKRVVGVAGDRLEFHEGHPIINGVPVPSCLVGTTSYDELGDPGGPPPKHEGTLYLELLGRRRHLAFYDAAAGAFTTSEGPYFVKTGEIFVLGDNRNNSHDSRMWWGGRGGGVPVTTVRGVAFVVWLSITDSGIDWSRNGLDLGGEPRLPRSMASLAPAFERCLAEGAMQSK